MARGEAAAAAAALGRRLWFARATLLWESLWPALWPATFVAGLFIATALFDPWRLMPGWLHAVVLVLFGAAFLVALARARHNLRLPTEAEAIRRIERASGLAHRPLGTLDDRPAAAPDDHVAERLWRAHVERMARAARRLRIGVAAAGLARRDPLAVRAALLLLLVIAIATAGENGASRLARALQPDLSGLGAGGPSELEMWITPPAYTGAAPMFLAVGAGVESAVQPTAAPTELAVPVGSTVLARVRGGAVAPRLEIDDESLPFSTVEEATHEVRATLTKGHRLAVTQGTNELAAWPLSITVDRAPVIEFASPPGRTGRSALRLEYMASDDYGLASVQATIRRADRPAEAITLGPPLPSVGAREAREISFHDLTPHPWAGLAVTITFSAVDSAGQTGESEALATVLPERIFNHPVARALIEQRKALTIDPSKRVEVSFALHEIALQPQHFFGDTGIYLGLSAARWRLLYDRSDKAIPEIQDLLWDLALSIEEGPLALAERDMREAQDALLEALSRDASDEEIDRLIEELRAAMEEFLDALVDRALELRALGPELEQQLMQAVRKEDLLGLLDRVRELYRTGARDAARELLSQLRQALESIRSGQFAAPNQQGMGQGEAALRDLERLIQSQQALLDRTFQRAWGTGEGGKDGPMGAAQQEALRQALADLMRTWSETGIPIPRPLGRAEGAMRDAGKALGEGQPSAALGPQGEAVDQLRQGAQAMLQALMEQIGRGGPPQPTNLMGLFGGARDPLGRNLPGRGYQDDGRTKLPDEADLQRSREILEELYRRANDINRPAIDRDYIRRLLRRF